MVSASTIALKLLLATVSRVQATTPFGHPGCPCINPVLLGSTTAGDDGKVAFTAGADSGVTSVSTDYASNCEAWDSKEGSEYYASCTEESADPPSWCADKWCYVDMCNCNEIDMNAASYFETSGPLKLGFSYTTCSAGNTGTSDYVSHQCPLDYPTADMAANCTEDIHCVFDSATSTCKGELGKSKSEIGCMGHAGCPCIDPVAQGCVTATDDKVTFLTPSAPKVCDAPKHYGAGCSAWDMAPGMEYDVKCTPEPMSETETSWCKDVWCYVDMCNCDEGDTHAATYMANNNDERKLGYSYRTCSNSDDQSSTEDYLTSTCSPKTGQDCTDDIRCKLEGDTCVHIPLDEIHEAEHCNDASVKAAGEMCSTAAPAGTCETTADSPHHEGADGEEASQEKATTTGDIAVSRCDHQHRFPAWLIPAVALATWLCFASQ